MCFPSMACLRMWRGTRVCSLPLPLLPLSFVMAQPPVPCTVTFAVVHPHGPLMTNTGGKVAGVGAVLLVGLEIGGHACVCHLCCCCVQDLGVC